MSRTFIPVSLRRRVSKEFRFRCCYCQTQENIVGMRFTIDHIIPEVLGGTTTIDNLCLACWDCNLLKQQRIAAIDPITEIMVTLFHPYQQRWHDHFVWQESGAMIVGLTPTGRATIAALQLNRLLLVQARRRWITAGWHPPQD